ncbi:MAG: hypothetical protein AUJ20_07355 [Comamonadaceae bacterium CG1_02_60_18]|nr:MAG: hypothetical protein AUJ20_07355 [Comamonadaceae bacterium CG1_02_60_18]PIQ52984.1 MAG: hypothetical protein COW02_07780 [Comamonadaceae bacterium CG12_big_fil_rev_8_21_14_0_65_59_15]
MARAPKRSWFPAFDPEVDHALFLIGHSNLLSTGWGQITLVSLVGLASYQRTSPGTLMLWLGYLVLIGLGYLWLYRYFQPEASLPAPNVAGVKRWQSYRRTLQFCSAVGWGCMVWLMVPGASVHNAVLMTVFTGVIGHAAAGNSANDYLGVVISAITTVVVFVWHIPAIFGADALYLMLMLVLYAVVLISSLGNTHRSLRKSIRLQLENKSLAISNAEQAARAEKANRDKSEFLAAASHDLRQPVHALLLLIEAYRQQVPAAQSHPLMLQIVQAGQSINSLFGALMELSRLESGTEQVRMAPVSLGQALQAALKGALPEARNKGLHLRSYVAPKVRSMRVLSDQVLLGRVIGNLISNAVRYTHRGGILVALRWAHQGGLWLEVWDTGIGISLANQERIFEAYVQVGNHERDRSKGLGLGLAIVKHAAELLGLAVSVRSEPGRGTRFRVCFPAAMLSAAPAAPGPTSPQPDSNVALPRIQPWLAGRRVLLVEDDSLVLAAMTALLTGWGIDLRCAMRSDTSVLRVCAPDWVPECVLCDFRLPGPLTGIGLLDQLQQQFPTAIGVLLTGEMATSVQQDAEDAGYLLLSKPVDASVLAMTLNTLLERRAEERSA